MIEDANDGTGTQVLLSDVLNPILLYTADIQDTNAWSSSFIDAFAWALAIELAGPLRADPKVASYCKSMFDKAFSDNVSSEQRGQREDQEPSSDFEASREA